MANNKTDINFNATGRKPFSSDLLVAQFVDEVWQHRIITEESKAANKERILKDMRDGKPATTLFSLELQKWLRANGHSHN